MKTKYLSYILTVLFLCSSCATTPTKAPIQSASLEQLTLKINTSFANLKSVKTNIDLEYVDPGMAGTNKCQGVLAYEKEGKLYLKGYKSLIPTFFTLVSDSKEFWLHVPRENIVLTGNINKLNKIEEFTLGLRPDDLIKAIEAQPIPQTSDYIIEFQTEPEHYIITVFRKKGIDKFMERQIWVERYFLNIEREIYYNNLGIKELEIHRSNYVQEGSVFLPKETQIIRTNPRTSLYWEMKKYKINSSLKPELFEYKIPDGVEIETITNE